MNPLVLIFSALLLISGAACVQAEERGPFRVTEYPLPRFASLRFDKVYVRTGPGERYPVRWVFRKKSLPVEIILEYDHWRKIRDAAGDEGWLHQSQLDGRRTALVRGDEPAALRRKPETDSRALVLLEPGVLARVEECAALWCAVSAAGYKGWVEKGDLWGVYEREIWD